jgi:lysophospholipase L1-like esterase
MNTNSSAKRILCYGDSLTWGYISGSNHERLPSNQRWTGILQTRLGKNYEIIEEGLNSRTLESEDSREGKEGRDGSKYLIPCLDTHDPLDLVILFLGINELKDSYSKDIEGIEKIITDKYIKVILNRKSQFKSTFPKLLLVSPPAIDISKEYAFKRYGRSLDKSIELSTLYTKLAKEFNISFINSAEYISTGDDGVHMTLESNSLFANQLFKIVISILENE